MMKISYLQVKNWQRFRFSECSSIWYVKTPSGYCYEGYDWIAGNIRGSIDVYVE